MRVFFGLAAMFLTVTAMGQRSDFILYLEDSSSFTLAIDGEDYDLQGALVIKITDIPSMALVSFSGKLDGEQPMAFYERIEFKGSTEKSYELEIPKRGTKLKIESIDDKNKEKKFEPSELGQNYVVYKYNHYRRPSERVRGEVKSSSSATAKRTKIKGETEIHEEDGKRTEKKEDQSKMQKSKASSTVIHQERQTTSEGDDRETSILRPRKEACTGDWNIDEKNAGWEQLKQEKDEPGKIYSIKKLAIAHCFSVKEGMEMVALLENEGSKIEIVKFIYPSLTDVENFDAFSDSFSSKSSWEAVELYIDIKYK